MAASLIIHHPSERLTVHGTEQEVADVVRGLTAGFEKRGGAWVTTGAWSAWVPSATVLELEMDEGEVEGVPMVQLPGPHHHQRV